MIAHDADEAKRLNQALDDWRALNERVIGIQRERDELQRAIMRLPQPPREMGDGPDERVTNILDLWYAARAEVGRLRTFIDAARKRVNT